MFIKKAKMSLNLERRGLWSKNRHGA